MIISVFAFSVDKPSNYSFLCMMWCFPNYPGKVCLNEWEAFVNRHRLDWWGCSYLVEDECQTACIGQSTDLSCCLSVVHVVKSEFGTG